MLVKMRLELSDLENLQTPEDIAELLKKLVIMLLPTLYLLML